MSHYTVTVVTTNPGEDDLSVALAPFNENIEVAPYEDSDGDTVTYNLQSKWDWYAVGGRWADHLLTLEGKRVDQVQRADLDIEGMRNDARSTYETKWSGHRQTVLARTAHTPWDAVREATPDDIESARAFYHHQPSILALKEAVGPSEAFWIFEVADDILVDDTAWKRKLQMVAFQAVPGWATLDHLGRWHEPGQMGWFGMSSDTESTRIGYYEAMNAYLESLDPSMWITMVDCHI